jgi:hypothetical protein
VFVRCTFWHNYIMHNDAHVDDLRLVVMGPQIGLSTELIEQTVWVGDNAANDVFFVSNGSGQGVLNYDVESNDASNSPRHVTVRVTVRSVGPDFDGDADVDLKDFAHLQNCFTGEGEEQSDLDCLDARLDVDDDVDGTDLERFLQCLSGTGVPADRDCDPA